METSVREEPFEVINQKPSRIFKCECGTEYIEDQIVTLDQAIYCEACLQKQLQIEKSEIQRLEEAYIFYKEYEGSISQGDLLHAKNMLVTEEEQKSLAKQEKELQVVLEQLKKEELNCTQDMQNLKSRVLELNKEETRYWEEMNKFERKLFKLEEKANTARWESKIASEEYERLSGFSVINEVFKITCEGEVALINGLALGKRPRSREVDWEEANAALGHLFLLFCYLVLKHQYTCVRMTERECLGSYSKVKIGGRVYEVSYSKQKDKEFGEVLDEFLIEFQLFHLHLKKTTLTQIELPYKIVIGQHTIDGQYINHNRIKNARWDTWSKSMKYFLTNFEYISANHALTDKLI